jgi:hypothetical protein
MISQELQTTFPAQKKAFSQKTDKWYRECIDAAEHLAIFSDEKIRQSYANKKANYDLANDVLDTSDIERVCNPFKIEGATFPAKMQNYPIANPKIDLLVGEESKRRFDWRVRVLNDDAISEKEDMIKQKISQLFIEKLQLQQLDENAVKAELQKLSKWRKYEAQDFRELAGTQILNHLWKEQELERKFNEGFQDALIASEEIYCVDVVANEPIMRKCNPLNIFTIRSGNSPYIEDSDIIIETGFYPPGWIIDNYYDVLSEKEVDSISRGLKDNSGSQFINIGKREPSLPSGIMMASDDLTKGHDFVNLDNMGFGSSYDYFGNIRLTRVVWKGLRKILEVTYFDEDGDEQKTIVDEGFPIKDFKDLGWSAKPLWISEWYEGTKIGSFSETESAIYVKMQPRPVQLRSMNNLSKCHPGYIGTVYNINVSKGMSLMDRMKPYQYLYNAFMYRTELAFAKYKGPIYELDLAKVPEHWNIDDWMYYAEAMGWGVVDSFKEGNKGQSTGKLAGNFNTTGKVLDANVGNYIQQNIQFLQYIEQQLGEIAGVTKQRQGQISSNELVGNTERAVTQSSHITEKWFKVHDNTKLRVLAVLLDTAKYAWRNKNKKLQHIASDLATEVYNIEGEQLREIEFDIAVTNSSNDFELMNSMKQLAHAGIQNDKINFSQLMDIMTTDSISSIRRKIEESEEQSIERQQQAEQAQRDHEQQVAQMQQESAQMIEQMRIADREDLQVYELEKQAREHENNITLEEMRILAKRMELEYNAQNDGNATKLTIEMEKLKQDSLQKEKERRDRIIERGQEFELKQKLAKDERKLKDKESQNYLRLEKTFADKEFNLEKSLADKKLKLEKENSEKDRELKDKHKAMELANKLKIEKAKPRHTSK